MSKDNIIYNEKCTKIIYKDKIIDFPFQTNIHELDKEEFIDCLYDLFNKEEKEKYDNFLDMLYGKFGKSITEKFLKPYNEKLYAVDLKELDVDAMRRFFPYANIKDIINNMKEHKVNSYNNTFLYPKNGAGSFINILYEELDKNKLLLNTSITKEEINKQLKLTLDNLLKLNTIDENTKLEEYVSIIMDPAYVHINTETTKEIDELKEKLSNNNIYSIGRYGAWIYNSMEDSMLKAKELAEKLEER